MTADTLSAAHLSIVRITPKTNWAFVEIEMRSGRRGIGEATAQSRETELARLFPEMTKSLIGLTDSGLRRLLADAALPTLAHAAIASALDQAAWDVTGKREGLSMAAAVAVEKRTSIPVYANINRRTLDRSAAGFAASALDAIGAGHGAVKIAPFDEVVPECHRTGSVAQAARAGLKRIAAVRDAIGDRRLMVDCHWRFDAASARGVIDAAAELDVHWIECPLPETDGNLEAIAALRDHANRCGVLLAGCEEMIRTEGFAPFLEAGAYDVIMPDVKYAGGMQEMLRLAEEAERRSVQVSLHNPSGPVCHAASLHFTAMLDKPDLLEMQFDETPLFERIQDGLNSVLNGAVMLPAKPGLGLSLKEDMLAERMLDRVSVPPS